MKFLVDESVEYSVVSFLRSLGYDTHSVSEQSPSLEDKSVLSIAYDEKRILITNDKDFGKLIHRIKLSHRGVILFRLWKEDGDSKIKRLKLLLDKFSNKLPNLFVVITENKVRFRKIA